jgi:proteasome accessory factor B
VKPTDRLLDLMSFFLKTRRMVTFAEIREAFAEDYGEGNDAAVRRKWERDKADLLALGLPLTYVPPDDEEDGEGGYQVDRERAYLPELKLTPDETAVLYLAGLSLVAEPSFPYREPLSIALAKMQLRVNAPRPNINDDQAALQGRVLIDVAGRAADEAVAARLQELEDAITRKKRVTFEYHARQTGAVSQRVVDPYGLFCRQGLWALVGRSHERAATRVFLVHRMRDLAVNGKQPGTPDFAVPADFRLEDHSHVPAWSYDVAEPVAVTVEIVEDFAWLAENELRTAGEAGAAGWRRFRVESTNPDALVSWVLQMGAKARLVAPDDLRARVRDALRAALAQTEGSP